MDLGLAFADPQDIGTSPTSPWLVVESDLGKGTVWNRDI